MLLQLLMVSGKTFANFLNDEFFVPLGMESTLVIDRDALMGKEAVGYTYKDGEFVKVEDWYMDWAMGSGNISSTSEDMFKWNEALYGGKIINKEALKLALKPHPASLQKDSNSGYAYGLNIGSSNDIEVISHGGGMLGFGSQLVRYPQHNLTIVVLNNMAPPPDGLEPDRLANEIAKIYLKK